MHRGNPGICITVGTIHTSLLPISGMGQFSAIYYYARSARLREYFDRATRLLTVTWPILFHHSLLNNFANRKKPKMMKSVLCAKWYSTTARCTTSDVCSTRSSTNMNPVRRVGSLEISRAPTRGATCRTLSRTILASQWHDWLYATGSVSRDISITPLMRHGNGEARTVVRLSGDFNFLEIENLERGLVAEGRQLTAEMRHEMDPGGFGGVNRALAGPSACFGERQSALKTEWCWIADPAEPKGPGMPSETAPPAWLDQLIEAVLAVKALAGNFLVNYSSLSNSSLGGRVGRVPIRAALPYRGPPSRGALTAEAGLAPRCGRGYRKCPGPDHASFRNYTLHRRRGRLA